MNIHCAPALCLIGCMPIGDVLADVHGHAIDDNWRFRVYLDDRPIGFHEFRLSGEPGQQTMHINARFEVSFMFINVYSYRHENVEHWQESCLLRLSSRTDDDGDRYRVRVEKNGDHTLIESDSGKQRIEHCVRSFAYWNRSLLDSERLLNAQTGELIEVQLKPVPGPDDTNLHYRLIGSGIDIHLWYSPDGRWQGLQSKTGDGYTLRYTLVEDAS